LEDENRRLKKMYSDLALDNDILREVIEKKLSKLSTTNEMLDKKYGKHGTAERDAFDEKMMAWYFGDYPSRPSPGIQINTKATCQERALGIELTPKYVAAL
jgi:hypothetical protein